MPPASQTRLECGRYSHPDSAVSRLRFLVLVAIAGACLAQPLAPAVAADASGARRLDAIQSQIEQLTQQLQAEQGKRGKLEGELRRAELGIARAAAALRILQQRLDAQQARIAVLDKQAVVQKQRVAVALRALRAQVDAAYRMGREPALKMLLDQENPALLGRMLGYFDYLNRERQKTLDAARAALAVLAATRRRIAAERKALQATLAEQRQKETSLKQAELSRRAALAALDRMIVSKKARLERLQADAKGLRSLIARVGSAAVQDRSLNALAQRPFAQQRGRLPWPTKGTLAVAYGQPRSGSDGALRWQGVLIRAPKGQWVRAIAAGRVVFANWLSGYGLLLIIDHGDGFMSLYGHLEAIYRPVGAWVRAGEVVASVGDSGGLRSSALYFAIRHAGAPLNPAGWCRGAP